MALVDARSAADDAADRRGPSDEELLRLVGDERRRAVGFDNDAELIKDREKALDYLNGRMPGLKAAPNRSKVVASDVWDTVQTIMPDVVEIFTGGEDVAAFIPRGPQDEAAAQQETDYVNYVVFQQNSGWLDLYTFFFDALTQKTGVITWWWEDEIKEETLKGLNLLALQLVGKDGEVVSVTRSSEDADGAPALPGVSDPLNALFDVTVRKRSGRLCVAPIPPEDFAVSKDTTINLQESPYCSMRARPRAQELLRRGISRDVVDALPAYGIPNDQINLARDTADESILPSNGIGDMRQVEVHKHWVRIYDEEQEREVLWQIETDSTETILISREEVERIQVAAITPYIVTHRFHGISVADLVMQIAEINTTITRAHLDSIYFALNQRFEVSDADKSEFTISDLLRNEPGMPVRSKTGNAVRAISDGAPTFSAMESLEYFQTKLEQRTGIVRSAQGMTPDTLHETAHGALALLSQAQKRMRMIARVFAETGVKDFFLGVHAVLRAHATEKDTVQLRGQWVDVDPSSWGERLHMTVEVGLGASGREQDLAALQALGPLFDRVLAMQGGPKGPLFTLQNAYNYMKRVVQKSGIKSPEQLLTDPSTLPPAPPAPPPPNPDMIKAQGQLQLDQARIQMEQQADIQEANAQAAAERYKADLQAQLHREDTAAEIQLARDKLAAELNMKRELGVLGQFGLASQVRPGGMPG